MGGREWYHRSWLGARSPAVMERNTKDTGERANIIAQELKSFEILGTQRSRKAYLNDKDKVMPRRRNINKRTAWLAEAAPETELGMSTGTGTGDLARPALAFLSTRTHHSCYLHPPQETSLARANKQDELFTHLE